MSDPEQHIAEPAYDVADEYRPEPPAPPKAPAWMDGSLRIGIHTSIAGDIVQALDIAHRIGANAVQIFSSSPRMWVRPQGGSRIAPADATRFIERGRLLRPVSHPIDHPINLASPERVLRTRSMQAFHDEIVRAMSLGADFLVIHPGSTKGGDRRSGVSMIATPCGKQVRGLEIFREPENFAGEHLRAGKLHRRLFSGVASDYRTMSGHPAGGVHRHRASFSIWPRFALCGRLAR